MKRNVQRWRGEGFSLTELLVVLAALATILVIVLPTFAHVVLVARRVHCAKTLSNISQAYRALVMDAEAKQANKPMEAIGWARRISPYLGYHYDALWCTATGKSDGMGYDATGDEGAASLPDVKIRIYNGSTKLYDVDTFTAYPYWLEGSHVSFGRVPGLWKLNAEVYASLDRYNMPQYTPGLNRHEYWFVIEDQRIADQSGAPNISGGDKDFNDFDLHVMEDPPNVLLTGYHKDAAYNFALVDMEGKEYKESGGTVGPLALKGVERLSYGMNSQVDRLSKTVRGASSTIVVVDYKYEVVATGDSIGISGEGWDLLHAPRHMGKMNALYDDGHVEAMDPDEINPELSVGEDYWLPPH